MAVADLSVPLPWRLSPAWRENVAFTGLFAVLAAFTLSTLDGGDVAPRILSAAALLLAAFYFAVLAPRRFTVPLPAVCLLLMACYGIVQTLWLPQKIAYEGWSSVLFWFTAAVITLLAAQLFRDRQLSSRFRRFFVYFGSAICVLDLLEQASHSSKYYWLIQSRYSTVNGTFAYWNNFAQFVELFLPLTLWFALKGQKPATPFLLLSGLEIGAVVASGSRAGSALVIIELLAVLLLAYLRNRNRAFLYAAASALAVSAVFVIAAGSETLSYKLQQKDQLAARRGINEASLDMIRQHPLTGWGLGTYVPVYRMFAHYDDGTYVNRAHNDWLQWTAEGGIFFSALMLIVFVWSLRPAIRSVWGIGVIAVCLHALVDYPFARFGVCGWYFALIGILAVTPSDDRSRRRRSRPKPDERSTRRKVAA